MRRFAVWGPDLPRVRLVVEGYEYEMAQGAGGWWLADAPGEHGSDYAFWLGDDESSSGEPVPDPRSAWQPAGVHDWSRIYDHDRFAWTDQGWTGRPLAGAVVYELHVGTFTPGGTLDAAIGRLDHLVELGVDIVELMPVAAFNGTRGWGYDGVCWYAVHEPYGGPDGLKRFVDACHGRGLAVFLDVVYNHFGPSGANATRFGPYVTAGQTGWGEQINLDGPGSDEVRRFIIDSAVSWLRDHHLDGLRLDAVHAFVDTRAVTLLEELSREVAALATQLGRPLSLVAESDRNDPRLVAPVEAGGYGLTAQWDDDFHHALHALLTGERQGYYADFGSLACLATVLRGAFFHAGTFSTFRGRCHGRPVDPTRAAGSRFVVYLQNHDQVGNRATGDRLSATLSPGLLKVGAALVLTSPYTPMLFMGEEWGARTPWQYFTSHPEPELAAAVAAGRRREFARHGWTDAQVPDPQDPATGQRSTLDWSELSAAPHRELLTFYRQLIALRRERPALRDPRLDQVQVDHRDDDGHRYVAVGRGDCLVVCNLGATAVTVAVSDRIVRLLLASAEGVGVGEDAVRLPGESVAILERDVAG